MSDLERFYHFLKGKMFERKYFNESAVIWEINGYFYMAKYPPLMNVSRYPIHLESVDISPSKGVIYRISAQLLLHMFKKHIRVSWSSFRDHLSSFATWWLVTYQQKIPRCCRKEQVKESKHHPPPSTEIRDD